MDIENFYERIKDKKVDDVYKSLIHELELLPPNGATIHKRRNFLNIFVHMPDMYESTDHPTQETIEQYKSRCPDDCMHEIKRIAEAIEFFKISI